MRISDWSSDVCSSDLQVRQPVGSAVHRAAHGHPQMLVTHSPQILEAGKQARLQDSNAHAASRFRARYSCGSMGTKRTVSPAASSVDGFFSGSNKIEGVAPITCQPRSDEHTSELQSLMRNSYA